MTRIAIANDHAGLSLKEMLVVTLKELGCDIIDLGTNSEASVDYPDFGEKVASVIQEKQCDFGVLICGSGVGISIAANRHKGVRAAVCHDATTARLCRAHNNANIICFGARLVGPEVAKDSLKIFLTTRFEGGRHEARVKKLG